MNWCVFLSSWLWWANNGQIVVCVIFSGSRIHFHHFFKGHWNNHGGSVAQLCTVQKLLNSVIGSILKIRKTQCSVSFKFNTQKFTVTKLISCKQPNIIQCTSSSQKQSLFHKTSYWKYNTPNLYIKYSYWNSIHF